MNKKQIIIIEPFFLQPHTEQGPSRQFPKTMPAMRPLKPSPSFQGEGTAATRESAWHGLSRRMDKHLLQQQQEYWYLGLGRGYTIALEGGGKQQTK